MADYINPFSGQPNPSQFDLQRGRAPSIMSAKMASDNQLAGLPFIDMAREGQRQELDSAKFKNEEFQSPWAQAARKGQAASLTAKGEVDSRSVEHEVEYNRLKGILTGAQIKEAEANAGAKRSQQQQEGFDFFASMGQQMSKLPAEARPMAYKQMMEAMKSRHPNATLPAYLQEYVPGETDSALMQLYASSLYSPKNQHELNKEGMQQAGATEREGMQNRTTLASTRLTQEGADRRQAQQIESGRGMSPAALQQQYRRMLADPRAKPEDKEMAEEMYRRAILDDEAKLNKDDPLLNSLAFGASTNPETEAKYKTAIATKRIDRLMASGLNPTIYDLMAESPGVSAEVLRAAFKRKYNKEIK